MQEPDAATIRKKMVGVLLRNARVRAGMTIKDASEATGLAPSAISDHEYGRRDISLPQLEVLAYTYRVPITYFWSDDPIPRDEERELPLEEAMGLRRRIIGVLLRQARMEAGHAQKDLAKVLDCPSGRITSYEFGRTDIPLQELEKLASYLGVPLSYFLDQGITPSGDQVAGVHDQVGTFEAVVDVHEAAGLVSVAPDIDRTASGILRLDHLAADRRRRFLAPPVPRSMRSVHIVVAGDSGLQCEIFSEMTTEPF